MSTTLKIGQSVTFTVLGDDGSTIPAGTLAVSGGGNLIAKAVDAANVTTITALATGTATINFDAPGFRTGQAAVVIVQQPVIVATPGPVTGP